MRPPTRLSLLERLLRRSRKGPPRLAHIADARPPRCAEGMELHTLRGWRPPGLAVSATVGTLRASSSALTSFASSAAAPTQHTPLCVQHHAAPVRLV